VPINFNVSYGPAIPDSSEINPVKFKEKLFSHPIFIRNELLTIFVWKIPSEVNKNHNYKKLSHD